MYPRSLNNNKQFQTMFATVLICLTGLNNINRIKNNILKELVRETEGRRKGCEDQKESEERVKELREERAESELGKKKVQSLCEREGYEECMKNEEKNRESVERRRERQREREGGI